MEEVMKLKKEITNLKKNNKKQQKKQKKMAEKIEKENALIVPRSTSDIIAKYGLPKTWQKFKIEFTSKKK